MQIIWKLPNGEIAITTLVEATDHGEEAVKLKDGGLIPADWTLDHVREDDAHFEITDPEMFPALTANGSDVVIDIEKARTIWRDKIRAARAPLLAALDIESHRAIEQDDAAARAAVIARKQVLRDLPADKAIGRAKTISGLRATWPTDLN